MSKTQSVSEPKEKLEEESVSKEEEEEVSKEESSNIEEKCIFDEELTLSVKKQNSRIANDVKYRIRIFIETYHNRAWSISIEIHKFDDIFFLKRCKIDASEFDNISNEYNLTVSFEEFIDAITSMLKNQIIGEKSTLVNYQIIDNGGEMRFYDVLDIKAVIIFAIKFEDVCKEEKREQAQDKFNHVKEELKKRREQVNVFSDEVLKRNSSMMDYIAPNSSKKSPRSPKASPKPQRSPKSPRSPKTPKSPFA